MGTSTQNDSAPGGQAESRAEADTTPPPDDAGRSDATTRALVAGDLPLHAAAVVRNVDRLSRLLTLTIALALLLAFFAALTGLESNADSDAVALGEYAVPKAVLPLAGALSALALAWLCGNRLAMLRHVLHGTTLPGDSVRELFLLHAPVLHVFDADNLKPWAPLTGVAVLFMVWGLLLGSTLAVAARSAVQDALATSQPDYGALLLHVTLVLIATVYAHRAMVPPLVGLLGDLHGGPVRLGWPRRVYALAIAALLVLVVNSDQLARPSHQADGLLGPAVANATDGFGLLMDGERVRLLGIRAPRAGQRCLDTAGQRYDCALAAVRALQSLVQDTPVVCLPLFRVDETEVAAFCRLMRPGESLPPDIETMATGGSDDDLARLQVAAGHAVAVGLGRQRYGEAERAAQGARLGLWQGAFDPPM